MILAFTVPGKPVPKQRARKGAGGRWYTPQATRQYEATVGWAAVAARNAWQRTGKRLLWPLDAQYAVTIRVTPQTRRRMDLDNAAKSLLDGITGVLWNDDSQVARLVVERTDLGEPSVNVIVTAIR